MLDIDRRINELYHHPDNRKALPTVFLLLFCSFFLNGRIIPISIILLLYFLYCKGNNNLLNNDERILSLRKYYKENYTNLKYKNYNSLINLERIGMYKKY